MILTSLVVGVVISTFFWKESTSLVQPQSAKQDKVQRKVTSVKRNGRVKKVTEISLDKNKKGQRAVKIVESEIERPKVMESIVGDGDEPLTELQRQVMMELQDALDNDDIKAVRKVVLKFKAPVAKGGLGGIGSLPKGMRVAAVDALGWFGGKAAVDLLEFVADSDEEVSQSAFDMFELALQDFDMGDAERSEIVSAAMTVLTDSEQIDQLLNNLTEMRNSRKVTTIINIMQTGTEQAKAVMAEQLEFYTDSDVATIEDIKDWLKQNPDDEDDESFYGGSKD